MRFVRKSMMVRRANSSIQWGVGVFLSEKERYESRERKVKHGGQNQQKKFSGRSRNGGGRYSGYGDHRMRSRGKER